MKYQSIYKVVNKIPYTRFIDHSDNFYDLWLIMEIPSKHIRVWVVNGLSGYEISTASLDYGCDTREYHESYKHHYFKRIGDMVKFIESELI